MNIGLDLGASEFRSVVQQPEKLLARRVSAEYVVIPGTPVNISMCERLRFPFLASTGNVLVCGPHAAAAAEVFHQPRVPVLPAGLVPRHDSVGRQLCDTLLQSILPSDLPKGTRIGCTLPLDGVAHAEQSRNFLRQLVDRRCDDVRLMHAATSLILAEAQSFAYTALGLCVGASGVSYSLCRNGTPLLEGCFPRGWHYLLEKFCRERHRYRWDSSGNKFLDAHWFDQLRRGGELDLSEPRDGDCRMLRDSLTALVRQTLRQLSGQLETSRIPGLQRQPLPLLVSGGAAVLPGFESVCHDAIAEAACPLRFANIIASQHEPFAVARGALIQLELDRKRHAA